MKALLQEKRSRYLSARIALALGALEVYIPEMAVPLGFIFSQDRYVNDERDEALLYLGLVGTSDATSILVKAADTPPPTNENDYLYARGLFGLLLLDIIFISMGGPQAHGNSVENPPLRLQPVCAGNRVYRCDCDLVAKLAKCSRQHLSAFLLSLGIRFAALLDKSHPLMQDLPNHTAEPMGNGPDGGLIAQPRQQTPEHRLKVTAVLLHRSVRRLVQYPPQISIPFCGAAAVVLFRTFVLAGTGSHPGGQLRR